ncbi:37s ribosomal protein s26 mitochondrial [Holotrichia oblita]|nr:37s ribosomal protein s26 mitochondrial [Holotrichia oblita]
MGSALSGADEEAKTATYNIIAINMPSEVKSIFDSEALELNAHYFSFKLTDTDAEAKVNENRDKLKNGEIDLMLVFDSNFAEEIAGGRVPGLSVYYNPTEARSGYAYAKIETGLAAYKSVIINNEVYHSAVFTEFNEKTAAAKGFAMLIPFLIITFLFSGSMAVAPDSIAGEKERGTIATILITPIKRGHLALGKVMALGILALMGAMSSFIGLMLSLPKLMASDVNISDIFGFGDYALILLVLVATTLLIVGAMSVISSFAKTVKEATMLITPLMILAMLAGVVTMVSGAAYTNIAFYFIPIFNSVQALVSILTFNVSVINFAITIISNLIYLAVCVFGLTKLFNSEKIMFSIYNMNYHYPFQLPPLPYAYNALEPYIDEKTMRLHHDKHLQTYINNLNAALKDYPQLHNWSLVQLLYYSNRIPEEIKTAVINNGGGVYNHMFYFANLKPPMAQQIKPTDNLMMAINSAFGSFETFKIEFKNQALSVFGSGYTSLVVNRDGNLQIINMKNQDTVWTLNACPIMLIDVWEHAYYLKYYNIRADYIDAWFNVSKNAKKYIIDTRWKLEERYLVYYGLRHGRDMFHKKIRLSKKIAAYLRANPTIDSEFDRYLSYIKKLSKKGIFVTEDKQYVMPMSTKEAKACTRCSMNDFVIPGVTFDENGLCPICASPYLHKLKSILPLVHTIPHNAKGKYDAAVFYTGGKDSTFLLNYLVNILKLRVLALTWEIPFISDCAVQSIENAKRIFPMVDFVVKRADDELLRDVYRKLMESAGNPCACPSLAYVLFYPMLVEERVPYLLLGNEPAQMANLTYFTIQKAIEKRANSYAGNNKAASRKKNPILKLVKKYENPLVTNVCEALKVMPEELSKLTSAIKFSEKTGQIPRLVHIDFNDACGGAYDWKKIQKQLAIDAGWIGTDKTKGLHTSCKIERVKEHSQWLRFRNKESTMIPFSAIELSLAVNFGSLTKEEAMLEMENHMGFTIDPPTEYSLCV